MKVTLTFEIECGETTCASEPGEFCRFLTIAGYSGKCICYLFGAVGEKDGWIQRHEDCLNNNISSK